MFSLDAAAFPVVRCPRTGLDAGVLPVTRVQFEYFLGGTTDFPEDAYAGIDRASPRAGWRSAPAAHPERVFLAGVRPDEAERLGTWLGGGFRLPTEAEWRAVDAAFGRLGPDVQPLRKLAASPRVHPAARAILGWHLDREGATWRAVGRLDGGLLEWVRLRAGGYGLFGRPPPALVRIVHNPQTHDPVRPTTDARHPSFGFRLVRQTPAPRPTP